MGLLAAERTPQQTEHRAAISRDLWLDRFGHIDPMTKELTARRWTPDLVLSRLQAFAHKHGHPPSRRDLQRTGSGRTGPGPRVASMPHYSIVCREFGSLRAALRAADLTPTPRVRPYERRVKCGECGRSFVARQSTATYCGRNCAHAAKLMREWAARGVVLKRCGCGCKRHVAPGRRFIRGHA